MEDENSKIRSSSVEYLTFITGTRAGRVNTVYQNENKWLSQKMISEI
jgi:hypothetical protein